MMSFFFNVVMSPTGDLVTTYQWWAYPPAGLLILLGAFIFLSGVQWINRKPTGRGRSVMGSAMRSLYMFPLTGLFIALAGLALAWGAATYRYTIHVDDAGLQVRDGSSRSSGQWSTLWEFRNAKLDANEEMVFLSFFRGDTISLRSGEERMGSYFPKIKEAILQRVQRIDLEKQRDQLREKFRPKDVHSIPSSLGPVKSTL